MSGMSGMTSDHSNTTVVRYDLDGLVEFLPSTNEPRVASACASYRENGEQVGRKTQNISLHLISSSSWWPGGSQTTTPPVQVAASKASK